MPKCFIHSEVVSSNGLSQYKVTFEADDGYQEQQIYQCTEDQLKDALTHFNDSHLAIKVAEKEVSEIVEPEVITVKSSKEALANLKKIDAQEVVIG